jgi:NTE family protein
MTPQHVISQLLESDTKYPKNLELLKKIIIISYLGRLRINGLPPDNKIALGNYLFDNEQMMFDFTRLSDEKKEAFLKWFLEPHAEEKEKAWLSSTSVNEYRGFTAEETLSWVGVIANWIHGKNAEHWTVTDLELSLNYQLTGIELLHGDNGILVGFKQFLVPPSGTKYKGPDDAEVDQLGNTKRVIITDQLVDQLINLNPKLVKPEVMCKRPHPQAIDINNLEPRFEEMRAYRKTQQFNEPEPWYLRIWRWITSFFIAAPVKSERKISQVDNKLVLLYEHDETKIYQREHTKEILVREKRPDIENLVLCGGGAKIFAHVGVWKALNEANIKPSRFAGSSAGAIMALMCYLGYSAEEITELFKNFKQEHLVQFDIDLNGLSDSHSLKAALDYAIAKRVTQIVEKYNIPYPQGKITFNALEKLRLQYPDCGLGKELIVTATNKKLRQTSYFSLARTPDMEVSEAVKTSVLFPVVCGHNVIDGEEHNDGGVLSNFPTEVFSDDYSTLLESEYGNNLKVLAVQFDNGTERSVIDYIMDPVPRLNFILNWFYSLLTGVSDPASGWEKDSIKLRQHAHQTIVPNVDNIKTSGFSVAPESQLQMIQSGYEATNEYLTVRYGTKEYSTNKNQELMYSTFSSLGDLLAYCSYRGNKQWFEIVNNLIVQSSLPNRTSLMRQSLELRSLYFNTETTVEEKKKPTPKPITFFGNILSQYNLLEEHSDNHKVLLILYPIFLKLTDELVHNGADKKTLEIARHSLTLNYPFTCLEHFARISRDSHILLHILVKLIKELRDNPDPRVYAHLSDLQSALYCNNNLFKPEYYGQWDLSMPQALRVLKLFASNKPESVSQLVVSLREREEPMQIIRDGQYHEDFSDGSIEGDRISLSA